MAKPKLPDFPASDPIEKLTEEIQALAERVGLLEEALKHHLEMPRLEARLEAATSRPQFLVMADGTRLNLSQVQSYKTMGERGISILMVSGHAMQWEESNTGTVQSQNKKRDAVLKTLDEQLRG